MVGTHGLKYLITPLYLEMWYPLVSEPTPWAPIPLSTTPELDCGKSYIQGRPIWRVQGVREPPNNSKLKYKNPPVDPLTFVHYWNLICILLGFQF